jgi:RNA polymerase sigma-70 factor (ECF subfamily)
MGRLRNKEERSDQHDGKGGGLRDRYYRDKMRIAGQHAFNGTETGTEPAVNVVSMRDSANSLPHSGNELSDAELVARFQNGYHEAFSELVERHLKPMTLVVLRMVRDGEAAKDIAQTTFLKAYESLSGFQKASSFKTWLYRIAVNTTKDHFRKAKEHSDTDVSELPAAPEDSPSVLFEKARGLASLRTAIEKLPEKQRLTLQLRIYDEMGYNEIAQILGGTEGGARANFFQAVRSLKVSMEDSP